MNYKDGSDQTVKKTSTSDQAQKSKNLELNQTTSQSHAKNFDLPKVNLNLPKSFKPGIKVYQKPIVAKFCKRLQKKFHHFRWPDIYCENYKWKNVRTSVKGEPLVWMVYGDEKAHKKSPKDMTMVFCGVHGDEITPMKFCFDILEHLEFNKDVYKDKLIVVAPLVNPDSFFAKKMTRTNARGVDVNRNLPTRDWSSKALRTWKNRYRSNPRRYPGKVALSEPETVFQVNLIKRYKPNKIISVHAPLTMIDYDGPNPKKGEDHHSHVANQLLLNMSKKASGYRVKDYPYFPGSLGNYAGKERKIPTYTLELPTSDPRYSKDYWNLFKGAIHHAFSTDLKLESQKMVQNQGL